MINFKFWKKKQLVSANQRLATPIGNFLDQLSYLALGLSIPGLLIFCAAYYWFANPHGQGTNQCQLNFGNSLYFSVISFSSLGYGDIAPIGFGKVVAATEVLFGLVLIALFVGKLASERQAALLLLVYTSEHQRRLIDFETAIYETVELIDLALDEHDHKTLNYRARKAYNLVSSIYNYLRFQANQGRLASYGNSSALKRLYQAFLKLEERALEAIQTYGTAGPAISHLRRIIERVDSTATIMAPFHTDKPKLLAMLEELHSSTTELQKWDTKEKTRHDYLYRNELNEAVLSRVKAAMPLLPWEKNVHKKVAAQLSLSINLTHRCISELVSRRSWPELLKGKDDN